ncbi:MAG: hypothetical protein H0V25_09785 [Solirubrobacterales bacterium]|nr:hypothetical protein [Solirubrobacterales bacterium]
MRKWNRRSSQQVRNASALTFVAAMVTLVLTDLMDVLVAWRALIQTVALIALFVFLNGLRKSPRSARPRANDHGNALEAVAFATVGLMAIVTAAILAANVSRDSVFTPSLVIAPVAIAFVGSVIAALLKRHERRGSRSASKTSARRPPA